YILWDEMAYARAGRPTLGAGIIAKTIMRFATDEQKAVWLPKIRKDEIRFALGYSEPEAGSDLASLRTRAELDGEDYVVNGEKIWTSNAETADYIWLLCRTGPLESRGAGLTLLIVDRRSEGIELRNGLHLDGHHYSQVFYNNVRVPAANRIGAENGAWRMMGAALADERHVQFTGKRVRRDFEDAVAWLTAQGLHTDPVVRARLVSLRVRVAEAEALCMQVLSDMRNGKDAGVAAAANKVVHTDVIQAIARFVMDVGGPAAALSTRPDDPEGLWRQTMIESVGGGTSEIMKSIVARQELGLAS
ncbi:MAG TPA: acyl-CoA dehydrogenase family protein, partial [Arenibaculum sp.]|nr:acyl-CoA dehydrogenase family protein [Arenibaculum sp.]